MSLQNTTYGISSIYNDIIELINSINNPSEYNYEIDFEKELKTLLAKKYNVQTEVKNMPFFDEAKEKVSWRTDLVIKCGEQYIPIELKYRDEDQSADGYGYGYIKDIDKIKYMLISYDDIPFGLAICLTNNESLIKTCKALQLNSNISDNTYLDPWRSLQIEWHRHERSDYRFGIAGWRWAGEKVLKSGKCFKGYWDRKLESK